LGIYSVSGRIGEHQAYQRSLRALKNLGWEYIGCSYSERFVNYTLTKHFYVVANYLLHKIIKPDFSISLTHYVKIIPPGYSMVYLNVPDLMLYSLKGQFSKSFPYLEHYNGYIDLFSVYNGENLFLKTL
jgi:hypothetical protein